VTSPRLFVSCYPYALIKGARVLGELAPEEGAEAETMLIKREETKRDESAWPCYRTVAQVEKLEPVMLVSDASGGLPQCRSRMSGRFLASACDVWLTIDDDLFAEAPVIERLVKLARLNRQAVFTASYLLRDGVTQSVGGLLSQGETELRNVGTTGMGLVAMHRDTLTKVAPYAQPAITGTGERYRAYFAEVIDEWCGWCGEDVSFSRRCREAGVPILAVADAPTCHAGRWSYMNPDGSFTVHRATPLGSAQAAQ